jgi:Protein of unknown function (DUF2004)
MFKPIEKPRRENPMDTQETQRREAAALDAIKKALGTEAGEDSVDLFVEHHLDEVPGDYWIQRLGTATPEPSAVIDLVHLRGSWGENDREYFDFTLPGDVTQYVLSVHFDGAGNIDSLSMES